LRVRIPYPALDKQQQSSAVSPFRVRMNGRFTRSTTLPSTGPMSRPKQDSACTSYGLGCTDRENVSVASPISADVVFAS
jgi:hypothetical protein